MTSSSTLETISDSTFVCECDSHARQSCAGESLYKEHEGKQYCVFHFPNKEKGEDFNNALNSKLQRKDFNFRGFWFPDEIQFTGDQFTGEVDFASATFNEKADFIFTKFSAEANFTRAIFRAKAYFTEATFNKRAGFENAVFKDEVYFSFVSFNENAGFMDVIFERKVNFMLTKFNANVYFYRAKFIEDAGFHSTDFNNKAGFYRTVFNSNAIFDRSKFNGEADFWQVTFNEEANFSDAAFGDYVIFSGSYKKSRVLGSGDQTPQEKPTQVFKETASLDLQYVRVSKPERVYYHTLMLRPHWFVNIDARKFNFTSVDWNWCDTSEEIKSLQSKNIPAPHRLLAIAYRHLAVNAEENHRYEEASKFHYRALDVQRLGHRRGFAFWRLSWWYWLASGYGERIFRAFIMLIGVWLLFALLYTQVGFARWEPRRTNEREAATEPRDEVGKPLTLAHAVTYSLGVMTLQKPEPRPATTAAQGLVILETILGPLQAALLALAIRRKFMR